MADQEYMPNWQKLLIILSIIVACTWYAFYSRGLDSEELKYSKVSLEKKLQEHEQTYQLVLNSYAKFIAKSENFSHPVVKQVSKLENGDLFLIIGDDSSKTVKNDPPGLKNLLKKKEGLLVKK